MLFFHSLCFAMLVAACRGYANSLLGESRPGYFEVKSVSFSVFLFFVVVVINTNSLLGKARLF